jgi:hypothetical protein
MREFSLEIYLSIVKAALDSGYTTMGVRDLFEGSFSNAQKKLVLRHDVDRRPKNALAMAQREAALGARATYYFRIVPSAFDKNVIREISELGHEVGYHYEDFHLAKYDPSKAISLFATNLERIRSIAPVSTICMHGSPLSKYNNMKLWEFEDFSQYNVKDCVLSYNWSPFAYFTDTGRTFGTTGANLRDEVACHKFPEVKTGKDLRHFLKESRHPLVMMGVHPERWDNTILPWTVQASRDICINGIKRAIRILRSAPS